MMPQVPRASTRAEVDKRIELWHTGPEDGVDLSDYLGWSPVEYDIWLMTGTIPKE